MIYKNGSDQNEMLRLTQEKYDDLKGDYTKAKESGDEEAMKLIVEEGKRVKIALGVMKNVIERKRKKENIQFDKDVEEVFGS